MERKKVTLLGTGTIGKVKDRCGLDRTPSTGRMNVTDGEVVCKERRKTALAIATSRVEAMRGSERTDVVPEVDMVG